MKSQSVRFGSLDVNGVTVFYRESGEKGSPTVLLLHGFPTSSHMFRHLIPILSTRYHVIAPDLPVFGFSGMPARTRFSYTFSNLARTMQAFIDKLDLTRFALYLFDYGAPIGYRLAMANPERITGIISQNGNAYLEGLSGGWEPIQRYWQHPTEENREALKELTTSKITRWQYEEGVDDISHIAPESYTLDQYFLDRPGNVDIQLDLLGDYRSNLELYPAFQAYFKAHQPKLLAVWGSKDPFFLPAGAMAYKRDILDAVVKFYDTGHFALETHVNDIGADILHFMENLV